MTASMILALSLMAAPAVDPFQPAVLKQCQCHGDPSLCDCGEGCQCAKGQFDCKAVSDPLIKCCDGTYHRRSEWGSAPLLYPSSPALGGFTRVRGTFGPGGSMGFSSCRGGG